MKIKNYPLLASITLSISILANTAKAEYVHITSVNGEYATSTSDEIRVHPGDVITLAADTISDEDGRPTRRDVEDFTWSADDNDDDVCDASEENSCLKNSRFEVNDYGVSFYVPYDMGKEVTISVKKTGDRYVDDDSLVLRNVEYSNKSEQRVVVSDFDSYSYSEFNENNALGGHGRWVYISGERYWVPYSYEAEWRPYLNGYWTWVAGDGWTWVSYDPWGWYTDHYGVWRHHAVYGWVWLRFETPQYRPHTVTWFQNDGYVGWYPYYDGWKGGYRHGYAEGFNDGYWAGYNAGRQFYANNHTQYYAGFTVVTYGSFNSVNIRNVYVQNNIIVLQNTVYLNRFGAHPGGRNLEDSHRFMMERNHNISITQMRERSIGGVTVRSAAPIHPVPVMYKQIAGDKKRFESHAPVGSVINRVNDKVVVHPPVVGGRGIAHPPMIHDQDGKRVALPPQTKRIAQPIPKNGTGRPSLPIPSAPTPLPVFNKPANRPSVPNQPNRPTLPHTRPVEPSRPNTPAAPIAQPTVPNQPHSRPTVPNQPKPSAPVAPPAPNAPITQPSAPNQPHNRPSVPNQPKPNTPVVVPPAPRPNAPVVTQPAPRPSAPVPQAPRPSAPVVVPQAPRPAAPAPQAPRPSAPVVVQPAPRPSAPVVVPQAPRPSAPVVVPQAPRPAAPAPQQPAPGKQKPNHMVFGITE